jgi:hypothetical protein
MLSRIEQAYVIHDPDNTSDHDPIVIKFMFELQHIGSCTRTHKPRVSWAKVTESDLCNYRNALTDRLRGFHFPTDALLCTDLSCNDIAHLNCVNDYSVSITNACIEAAEATIPLICVRPTSGRIPGWSERVQPLREKSLFWHQMWIDFDRPKTGAVADSMRRTRAAYHYASGRLGRARSPLFVSGSHQLCLMMEAVTFGPKSNASVLIK